MGVSFHPSRGMYCNTRQCLVGLTLPPARRSKDKPSTPRLNQIWLILRHFDHDGPHTKLSSYCRSSFPPPSSQQTAPTKTRAHYPPCGPFHALHRHHVPRWPQQPGLPTAHDFGSSRATPILRSRLPAALMANPARRDASAPPTSTADDSRRVRFVAPVRGPYLDGTSLDLLVPSRSSSPPALPPADSSHSSVWAADDARNDARIARGSYLLPLPVVPPRAVVAAIQGRPVDGGHGGGPCPAVSATHGHRGDGWQGGRCSRRGRTRAGDSGPGREGGHDLRREGGPASVGGGPHRQRARGGFPLDGERGGNVAVHRGDGGVLSVHGLGERATCATDYTVATGESCWSTVWGNAPHAPLTSQRRHMRH